MGESMRGASNRCLLLVGCLISSWTVAGPAESFAATKVDAGIQTISPDAYDCRPVSATNKLQPPEAAVRALEARSPGNLETAPVEKEQLSEDPCGPGDVAYPISA